MNNADNHNLLNDWKQRAWLLEERLRRVIVGQDAVIQLITVSLFARGHVLLEGDVGVGKTTMLRAFARAVGGGYARIEGTVDLMSGDLVYYTYLNEQGKPQVDPGPLLHQGEALASFFFNEINRARPQVHSLLLRVMAERSLAAFNREFRLPHLQVFADRNRLEKEETFELPSAARDRFLMELNIETPGEIEIQRDLMINPRFHDTDALIASVEPGILPYAELNQIGAQIQRGIHSTATLQDYVLNLCRATREPEAFGVTLSGVDVGGLVKAGVSPRGMSMLLSTARVAAWLQGREAVMPEDVRLVFRETIAHRVFLRSVYEIQRDALMPAFIDEILERVAAP